MRKHILTRHWFSGTNFRCGRATIFQQIANLQERGILLHVRELVGATGGLFHGFHETQKNIRLAWFACHFVFSSAEIVVLDSVHIWCGVREHVAVLKVFGISDN